jgi:hypothetical protein
MEIGKTKRRTESKKLTATGLDCKGSKIYQRFDVNGHRLLDISTLVSLDDGDQLPVDDGGIQISGNDDGDSYV